ncbi:MAG: hypothetical protein IIA03_13720 [Proteobacteria bacterium]|nr:hypothetical protein [Pseudomonadota bacterium]
MQKLNVDFGHIARELVRNFSDAAGSVRRTGMVLVDMAVARNYPIGPFPAKFVRAAMNRLGDLTLPAPQWHDLGESATTHHCNYFQDGAVLAWLDALLR